MHRVAMVVVLAGGCIRDPNVVCGDIACPSGAVCTASGCATPDQLAACANHVDGDACTTPAIAVGTCVAGVCQPLQCGDGKVVAPEVCDDGNQRSGDGCSADCRSTEVCGNGYIDPLSGEQCDNGIAGLSRDGCTSQCTAEFDSWFEVTPHIPQPRVEYGAAYDAHRHRVVVFGGFNGPTTLDDTIEWDGRVWRTQRVAAPANSAVTMAYDSDRHRIVMFGGHIAGTWEYDGIVWERHTPATQPMLRTDPGMAYDPVHHQIVMFGGVDVASQFGDTWTWDGTTWTQHVVSPAPMPGRTRLAWDGVNARVLGYTENTGETWAWSGSAWVLLTAAGPGARAFMAITNAHGGHVLLYGGANNTETWEWAGAGWTQRTPSSNPGPLSQFALAYDSDRDVVVAFSGGGAVGASQDTWEWNDSDWTKITPDGVPVVTNVLAMAYLPTTGKVVSFGDVFDGETWEWDGVAWERAYPPTSPPVRFHAGMTATRDGIVIFGGNGISAGGVYGDLDETWRYDGTTWAQLLPAHVPAKRIDAGLGYDARRDRVVMYGGSKAIGTETWEWDGSDWTQMTPAHIPPPAPTNVAIAFDRAAAVMVLYVQRETWAWDGVDWIPLATGGPNVATPIIAYDPVRARVLLEGYDQDALETLTWEWSGGAWTIVPAIANPDAATDTRAMTYDAAHGEMALYYSSRLQTTWVHRYFSQTVPADTCIDTDTDGDGLVGCADPDCAGRCTPGCAPGETCDSSTPHCGDGTCSVLEDYRLCPSDCSP